MTEEGMVIEVRKDLLLKQPYLILVTLYALLNTTTLAGMVTSVAEPLYHASSAVFVSVSKQYQKSPSV